MGSCLVGSYVVYSAKNERIFFSIVFSIASYPGIGEVTRSAHKSEFGQNFRKRERASKQAREASIVELLLFNSGCKSMPRAERARAHARTHPTHPPTPHARTKTLAGTVQGDLANF